MKKFYLLFIMLVSLCLVNAQNEGDGKTVVFITDKVNYTDSNGTYADSMNVAALRDAGFTVTVPDYADYTTIGDEQQEVLKAADAVVIGRGISSGDFDDDDDVFWEKLQKPIVLMSNYLARANRLAWFASNTTVNVARFGTIQGKIEVTDDDVLSGVTSPFDFLSDNLGMIELADSVLSRVNGTVLVTLTNGSDAYSVSTDDGSITDTIALSEYEGTPLMVRFAPNEAMYSGGAFGDYEPATPLGWRTYIAAGDDHDYDDATSSRIYGFYVHSEQMLSILVDEIVYLTNQEVEEISDDNTLSALSVEGYDLSPTFSSDETDYSVSVAEGTESVTINATANDETNATVEGTGEFTTIPGTATVTVTAEDGSTREYIIVISESVTVADGVVSPDKGQLYLAITNASDGDTLILANGITYSPAVAYTINKKIVFMPEEMPSLPAMENMPVINNQYSHAPLFTLDDGGHIVLNGIEIDNNGAGNIICPGSSGGTIQLEIDRCRIHNCSGSGFVNSSSSTAETTFMPKCHATNTFFYDIDEKPIYLQNLAGPTDVLMQNNTYWNIGQQLTYLKWNVNTEEGACNFVFDHLTLYNISSDASAGKEIFGNSTSLAVIDITMSNSIFMKQGSSPEDSEGNLFSIKGGPVDDGGSFTIDEILLYDVHPISEADFTGTLGTIYEEDPQFTDADSADFTVGNTDLYTVGTDGEILGAVYWHPEYTETAINEVTKEQFNVTAFPNPCIEYTEFSFELTENSDVMIEIFNLNGQLIKQFKVDNMSPGSQTIQFNARSIKSGIYTYRVSGSGALSYGKLIKL